MSSQSGPASDHPSPLLAGTQGAASADSTGSGIAPTKATAVRSGRDAAPAEAGGQPRRWLAAVVLMAGALMDLIDGTIVNVALPTIRRDLHASATQLEWVVSAYLLSFAASLIIAGSMGDRFGRKRLFLVGAGIFGVASLAAGVSGTAAELIAGRIVQGVAGASMAPQVLATFRVIFSGPERGRAFALYGAMAGVASALGLILGGVLTSSNVLGWSWRAVFFVNVPVALLALVAGGWLIPETRNPVPRRPNLPAAAVLAAGLVAVVYPLLEGRQFGWPVWTWLLMAAGVAAVAVLAFREARTASRPGPPTARRVAPLLRPRLLLIPAFAAGLGIQLTFGAGLQGLLLMFALWLQDGEHFSPLKAGLTALALSIGCVVGAPAAVPLAQKYGRRVLVFGGLLMAAGSAGVLASVSHVGVNSSPWPIVPGLVTAGIGLAFLILPLANVALATVPADAVGGASGLFNTAQQLGGAVGVALFGTVYFGWVGSTHTFAAATTHTGPYVVVAFILCAMVSLKLPRTAISEGGLIGID